MKKSLIFSVLSLVFLPFLTQVTLLKYHFTKGNSIDEGNLNGQCYFFNSSSSSSWCNGTCKDTIDKIPGGSHSYLMVKNGTDMYCTEKQTYYWIVGNSTLEGEYNISNVNDLCVYGVASNWNSCLTPDQAKISQVYITSDHTSLMGSSLVNAGSGLLHIGIQLLPYAIAFTIILLIFGLIKNWSKLRNKGLGDSYYSGSRVKRNYGFNIGQDEIDLLNFYEKEEGNFDGTGKYYRASNGKVAYRYKYDGKWYTTYDSDEAIIDDVLPDKEHHYKKRHGLYND